MSKTRVVIKGGCAPFKMNYMKIQRAIKLLLKPEELELNKREAINYLIEVLEEYDEDV